MLVSIANRKYSSKKQEFEASVRKHFGYVKTMQTGEILQNKYQPERCLWKDPQSICAKLEIYAFENQLS